MNIVPAVRSVTEFRIMLSETDVVDLQSDPAAFGRRLAEQLGASAQQPGGGGVEPVATPARRHPRKGKAGKRSAVRPNARSRQTRQARASGQKEKCPNCPRMIAPKFMPRHLLKKHGVIVPAANGAHPEAAPVAG